MKMKEIGHAGGGGGAPYHPLGSISLGTFFQFHAVFGKKVAKVIGWHPYLRACAPLDMTNPGSAT